MIQLRLIYHHTDPDGLTTYQGNTTNAYNIMRTGRLIDLVNRKFGPVAARIMETLTAAGFATAHTLEAQLVSHNDFADHLDRGTFRVLLEQLIRSKYIKGVRETHFQPPHDARQHAECFLRDSGSFATGTTKKAKADADAKIEMELKTRSDGSISASNIVKDLSAAPSKVLDPVSAVILILNIHRTMSPSSSIIPTLRLAPAIAA